MAIRNQERRAHINNLYLQYIFECSDYILDVLRLKVPELITKFIQRQYKANRNTWTTKRIALVTRLLMHNGTIYFILNKYDKNNEALIETVYFHNDTELNIIVSSDYVNIAKYEKIIRVINNAYNLVTRIDNNSDTSFAAFYYETSDSYKNLQTIRKLYL